MIVGGWEWWKPEDPRVLVRPCLLEKGSVCVNLILQAPTSSFRLLNFSRTFQCHQAFMQPYKLLEHVFHLS